MSNIAIVGVGWWSQGWHIPCLDRNGSVKSIILVDPRNDVDDNRSSNTEDEETSELESLSNLKQKYKSITHVFSSVEEMLQDDICNNLDGIIIATPHASHYQVYREVTTISKDVGVDGGDDEKRSSNSCCNEALHFLMEKPMTTDVNDAIELYKLVVNDGNNNHKNRLWINHSACYRREAQLARETIEGGKVGKIQHLTAFFAAPLKWLFEDPKYKGWNEPSNDMIGNGFAWGQASHLLAFLYHICPTLQPIDVFCTMQHSKKTGADISFSATIRCATTVATSSNNDYDKNEDIVVMTVSGSSLIPGSEYSSVPVPKKIMIEIFGDEGNLSYKGNDRDSTSGCLELRKNNGSVEILHNEFHFENTTSEGLGPESLQSFVRLCDSSSSNDKEGGKIGCNNDTPSCNQKNDNTTIGSDVLEGLRVIQTIDAMYRSNKSKKIESIVFP